MTKTKATKKALFMSMLSLLVCIAMRVGTTFAWFTDSVTSGRNKITAGNLDIELYHGTGMTAADKVDSDTKLFLNADGTEILWEPGVMAYENFTVKNAGSLALKYRLAMNVWGNNTVTVGTDQKSLADVIKVAILEDHFEAAGGRDAALGQSFTNNIRDFVKVNDDMAPGDEQKFAVILYWEPTDKDNDYNLNNGKKSSDGLPLWIELGVNLDATQTPHESDSFDKNYDAGLELPVFTGKTLSGAVNAETKKNDIAELDNGYYHIGDAEISADVPADSLGSDITEISLVVETIGATETSYDLDISLHDQADHVITATGAKMFRINLNIGAGKTDVAVSHAGTVLANDGGWEKEGFKYDEATGMLSLYVSHFSLFKITWTVPEVPDGTKIPGTLSEPQNEDSQQFYSIGDENITADIPTENVTDLAGKQVFLVVKTLDADDDHSYNLDISLVDEKYKKVANVAEKMYRVSVHIGGGLFDVTVDHAGETLNNGGSWTDEGYTYDIDTGVITMYVKHFSEFRIAWGNIEADRLENLNTAGYKAVNNTSIANSYFRDDSLKVYLTSKSVSASWLTVAKDTIIDLNNNTLNFIRSRGNGIEVQSNSNLFIRNGILAFGSTVTQYGIEVTGNSHIILENCTMKAKSTKSAIHSTNAGAIFILRNCTSTGNIDAINGKVIIVSGTYSFNPTPYLATYSTVTEQDGQWVVTSKY